MVGNGKYYITSAKQDGTVLNISKTGKKDFVKRNTFSEKGKARVNFLKIKLIIDMLHVAYIQFSFSNLELNSYWQLMFFTTFLYTF